ncbi:MAG: hypothetical protein C0490_16845, partial [Marivirga sp.]|nr:hypothetical protein [Marivirga sp.]
DEIIEGPPSNANTPQANSKPELIQLLRKLKKDLSDVKFLISKTASTGKTKHPGLHYLTASEWYQFAEMHFRHHLRQKKRIEAHLKDIGIN